MERAWLKELLRDKQLTHQKVADAVSVDRAYITQIINGNRRPSPDVAQKLGKELNFDWTIFFTSACNEMRQERADDQAAPLQKNRIASRQSIPA
jgi:transcriptional regulator with XRE-family HTH domain